MSYTMPATPLFYTPGSAVMVRAGETEALSGGNLASAYAIAANLTPGNNALSDANPADVIIPPGRYDVSAVAFCNTALRLKELVPNTVTFVTHAGPVAFANFVQADPTYLFTRASTAYDGANVKQKGQPRTHTLRFTPPCTAVIDAGSIWAVGGDAVAGVYGTNGSDVYYRSPTATGWGSAVGTIASASIKAIWRLSSGTLIAGCDFTGAASKLYRSADAGATWTLELTMEYSSDDKRELCTPWGLYQAPHGTICFGAYGSVNDDTTTRNIYRSVDDGSTWASVEEVAVNEIDHWHCVGYQETLETWVAAAGDSAEAYIYESTDDGASWGVANAVVGPGAPLQPARFVDYGHATKLMFASDKNFGVGTYDVSDYSLGSLWGGNGEIDAGSSRHYTFDLFVHEGILYACLYDNSSTGSSVRRPAILVSDDDGANWTVYWRDDSETLRGSAAFAGFSDGYLFLQVTKTAGGFGTLQLPPVRSITAVTGTVLEPGYTPANSAVESTCENTLGYTFPNCTGVTDSDNEFIGTNCVKVTANGAAAFGINTPKEEMAAGEYCMGFRVKGTGVRSAAISATADEGGTSSEAGGINITPDWQYFVTGPAISSVATDNIRLYLSCTPISATPAIVYVDSIAIIPLPCNTWHLGADARADETVSFARTVGASWADSFVAAPSNVHRYLANVSTMYVRTWKLNTTNHLKLRYVPSTRKFGLVATIGGDAQTAIELDTTSWQAYAPIQFVVEADADGITLRMHNGNTWESATGAAQTALLSDNLTVQSGDNSKANLLPHVLVDGFSAN